MYRSNGQAIQLIVSPDLAPDKRVECQADAGMSAGRRAHAVDKSRGKKNQIANVTVVRHGQCAIDIDLIERHDICAALFRKKFILSTSRFT